jgi:membrane protein
LLPFILLLVALPSVTGTAFGISDPGQQVAQKVEQVSSEDMGNTIRALLSEVEQSRGWSALLLGLGGALWAGTSTISTIRKALNRIHDCEEDTPFWKKKATELLLTVVTGIVALSAVVAAIAGPALLGLSGWWSEALFIVYSLAAAMVVASLLYWLAPADDHKFRWVTPGAGLFVIVWLLFSAGFSLYISNFSNMNHVYGTLGMMLVAIIWLYWSTLALLAGAELNAILMRHNGQSAKTTP